MKKEYLIISICILLVLSTCLYVFISDDTNRVVISSEEGNKSIVNTNALTMMYETEAESGEYQIASDTVWPESGYTFNETLSRCENGSTLIWDEETKRVLIQANTSDKCYVYFDALPPELKYAYNAIEVGTVLTFDISSSNIDEIGLYFDDYMGGFDLNGHTISKLSNSSNDKYSLNFGINSNIYISNSSLSLTSSTVTQAQIRNESENSPSIFISNSQVQFNNIVLYSNYNDFPIISLNNSNIIFHSSILDSSNSYLYVKGESIITNANTNKINLLVSENSILSVENTNYFESKIDINNQGNLMINNLGNYTGCINPENNQNANIQFSNLGTLNLTCDSFIYTFLDSTNYANVNSNGYNIYYDRSKMPDLNGETISLNGGGSLLPYN